MTPPNPRFAADQMLGSLARRLRILGYDTLYEEWPSDADVLGAARRQGRILLTRDTRLMQVRELRDEQVTGLLIESDLVGDQVKQVMGAYRLKAGRRARCAEDNERLVDTERTTARHFVPRYVYQTQTEFLRCPRCNRFYWPGTHWQKMRLEWETGGEG